MKNSDDALFSGKIAVVTGAGRSGEGMSVGRAIALALAERGATVAVVDRDCDAADATVAEIIAERGAAFTLVADVSREADCQRLAETATERSGRVDILVNNVAVGGPRQRIADLDSADWAATLGINATGAFLVSKYLLPLMPGGSAVVNISSVAARFGGLAAAYNVSKGALESFTKTLAAQYGSLGIRANAVAPGQLWSNIISRSCPEDRREALREQRCLRTLLNTEGTPRDVANAVAFLASDASRWITGQVLTVDGGFSLNLTMD